MAVNNKHKEYEDNIKKWQLVRDCNEGSAAIKSRTKGGATGTLHGLAGTAYLPAPNPTDISDDNKERYYAYRDRANFVNFTGHTKEGLLGLVFRKDTEIETDATLEYLKENANGAGLSTEHMIKDSVSEILMIGRQGLLVDYPQAEQGLTVAQVKALGLRANILAYDAEDILNWKTETYGGVTKLSMVVLREPVEKKEDKFTSQSVDYYRVLLLKEVNGKITYVQNLYDNDGNLVYYTKEGVEGADVELYEDVIPTKFDGSTWDEIPFIFIGSVNNDANADKSPLYDIAEVNIAHYRNSADFEESSFLVGQPTPVFSGLNQGWVDKNFKDGIALGSRSGIVLPENGNAMLLQAASNQMPEKGMEMKEQQMVKIGTRIIQDTSSNETAEGARIRFTGQNSKLGSIIGNVEDGYKKCYMWAGMFMNSAYENVIKINREFYDATIDPQMIIAQIQLMDRGVITKTDIRDNLRTSNLLDAERTDDVLDAEAEDITEL